MLELVPPLSWGALLLLDELEVPDEEEEDDDEDEERDSSDSAPTITVGTLETVRHGMILPFFFKYDVGEPSSHEYPNPIC